MADRPIIFSGPMVRALLEVRKSQDRGQAPETHRHCGRPEDAGAAFPQDHEISPAGEGRSQQAASASPTCPIRRQGGKCEMTSLRKDNPALWAEFTAHIRDVVGDWTDDQIAAVASKVRARSPGALMDSIAEVFVYCGAALKSGDEEAIAAVELWQMPELPIEIEIIDGKVSHRISPDVDVEIVQ